MKISGAPVAALLTRPSAQAKRLGGRLCLDFANGVGGWKEEASKNGPPEYTVRDDRFLEYADLIAWAFSGEVVTETQAHGLLREASSHSQSAQAVWKRGLRLRSAIHDVARALTAGRDPETEDLAVLAREASQARAIARLAPGASNLEWRLPEGSLPLDAILGPVALSAEDYFTRADLTRLHACPGDSCGWLFEDVTRNRSRRWCDMGDCGNSAKVRQFRARQAGKA